MVKLSDIKKNPDNPRIIKDEAFEKLCNSIKDFDKMMSLRPLVIDENNIVLGGNMRLAALKHLGYKEVPEEWVKRAADLTEEEKHRFIIADNVGFGLWDWDALANSWDAEQLNEWGLKVPVFDAFKDNEELTDDFSLKEGGKEPFQQMTFTFSDEQATEVKNFLAEIKKTDEFKYFESENENSNGNALYLICKQWAEQKTSF